uniref:Immunodeficiency virus type I enhancer binding protein 3a n=1 Tax=Nothobranchius korthausae TaxID=1143690 RepID=A0A1A8H2Y4_9TELE
MEVLHSQSTTGEQSGGQEHCQIESVQKSPQCKSLSKFCKQQQTSSSKSHCAPQSTKQTRRHNSERKRLRQQRQSIYLDSALEKKQEASAAIQQAQVSSLSSEVLPSSADVPAESSSETQEDNPKQKREHKPQRPGKYVCTYCGRACAKPSVLQKHIRSHTGERPYPCAPCGFSFKTKSNLYKHRKSHTHRVKAGLALGEPKSLEDQITESEDETRQLSSVSSLTNRQNSFVPSKSYKIGEAKDCTGGRNYSNAVKRRLALRLSRGKHASQESSDDKTCSLNFGSKGSTESGYFSRSESTEQSQDSPPNTNAKSYAEIILGKYGRFGQLQRIPRHHNQQVSGQEEKNIPFVVPKKQVIDHITKLITINEAVVDTSKIDSVKPRRFSLSRKNSSEAQRNSGINESLIHSPKAGELGYKSTGSISMGVPCEKFHHSSLKAEQAVGQITTSSLIRSHSMPSASSSVDTSSGGTGKLALSQSFDEQQPSKTQMPRRFGTLRRQPAIEIPLGTELSKGDHGASDSFYLKNVTTVFDQKQRLPQPYECEACGTGCKDWEGYKKHKKIVCFAHHSRNEMEMSQLESLQLSNPDPRAGASMMRKRRKEESFEFDDPSSSSLSSLAVLSGQCKNESRVAHEDPRRSALQTCSVIQHTSSFEKQESLCHENQSLENIKNSPPHEEHLLRIKIPSQHKTMKLTAQKLVCQKIVQVPGILVTEDISINSETSMEPTSSTKTFEKPDEFQWPQRSPSLAQLPIEKLPPKKKRLRLAEAAQSSGESSFDSVSLPQSPSQDSSASFGSSRSTSYEEPNRADMEVLKSTPLRRSRALHMLTVPGVHQHREMRRSASEQAPHDPQPSALIAETRSKSFDYSCLSPERSAIGWKERRRCLLMRHSVIRDQDEEDQCSIQRCSPEGVSTSKSSQTNPSSGHCSRSSPSLSSGRALSNPERLKCKESVSKWKQSHNIHLMTNIERSNPKNSVGGIKDASYIHPEQLPPQAPQPSPSYGPSGAARAHYLPMATGLKLEIPSPYDKHSDNQTSHSQMQQSVPLITSRLEVLRPPTSPSVVVRLQTDTLTPACAIYTTLSQTTSPKPLEGFDAVSPSISISSAEHRNHKNRHFDQQPWSDDGQRSSGSGSNKRMLSPSNSTEFHPELQQQKRVKEEEEKEMRCTETAAVDRFNQELKQEIQSCLPNAGFHISSIKSSFPSLLSGTCNSWCYLNYIKPNPSTLDEQKPSVYSSWSTSSYDPNPPGLSSKTALSLLHCKQRLSPSIYTTSSMSVTMSDSREKEDIEKTHSTEVNSPTYSSDHGGQGNGQLSASDSGSGKFEKEDKNRQQEQAQSCSRNKQLPKALMSKRRLNLYSDECGGGEEKNAIVFPTESLLSNSNQSSSTLEAPVKLVESVMSEKGQEEEEEASCHKAQGVLKDQSVHPHQQKVVQEVQVGKDAARENEDVMDKHEGSRSGVSHTNSEKDLLGDREMEYSSSMSLNPKKSSASVRRALFARRRLYANASMSSGVFHPPSTPSPSHSPSPTPCQSPATSSPVSSSALPSSAASWSAASPLRGPDSSGSPSFPAGCSVQSHTSPPPQEHMCVGSLSGSEASLIHISPHLTRVRGLNNLLSHLPLHSQQPNRSPSLLIPIGGIHMIQPRSTLPLYSLVCSQTALTADPTSPSSPTGRFSVTLQQNAPNETDQEEPEISGQSSAGEEGVSVQQASTHGKVIGHPDSLERHVYINTNQGQKTPPSSQTHL